MARFPPALVARFRSTSAIAAFLEAGCKEAMEGVRKNSPKTRRSVHAYVRKCVHVSLSVSLHVSL